MTKKQLITIMNMVVQSFRILTVCLKIADKRIDSKMRQEELGDGQYTLKVEECFSGIELRHFCKNEAYSYPDEFKTPIGFGIFRCVYMSIKAI